MASAPHTCRVCGAGSPLRFAPDNGQIEIGMMGRKSINYFHYFWFPWRAWRLGEKSIFPPISGNHACP